MLFVLGIAVIGKSPSGANITVSGDWSGNDYTARARGDGPLRVGLLVRSG